GAVVAAGAQRLGSASRSLRMQTETSISGAGPGVSGLPHSRRAGLPATSSRSSGPASGTTAFKRLPGKVFLGPEWAALPHPWGAPAAHHPAYFVRSHQAKHE